MGKVRCRPHAVSGAIKTLPLELPTFREEQVFVPEERQVPRGVTFPEAPHLGCRIYPKSTPCSLMGPCWFYLKIIFQIPNGHLIDRLCPKFLSKLDALRRRTTPTLWPFSTSPQGAHEPWTEEEETASSSPCFTYFSGIVKHAHSLQMLYVIKSQVHPPPRGLAAGYSPIIHLPIES